MVLIQVTLDISSKNIIIEKILKNKFDFSKCINTYDHNHDDINVYF